MNTHKNARLTYLRRLEMVQDLTEGGLCASEAAAKHGVSAVTARKWLAPYLVDGAAGLLDKPSRPEKSPRAIAPGVALTIVELRRKLLLQSHIASYMGVPKPRSAGCCAAPGCPVERSAAPGDGPALRARPSWRAAAHRHQETGPLRQGRPSHHGRPPPASSPDRLGLRLRSRGRP